MTRPAEYGQLMTIAQHHALAAYTALSTTAFTDHDHAVAALAARGRLLHALADHAEQLIGPARVAAWRLGHHDTDTTTAFDDLAALDDEAADFGGAVTWITALRRAPDTTRPNAPTIGTVPSAALGTPDPTPPMHADRWLDAARQHLRTATDLVATHRDATGTLRPGAPVLLTERAIGPILARCLQLADLVTATEPLALRCRQAGLTRAQVDHAVPLDDPTLDATITLTARLGYPRPGIDALTVARPDPTTTDPDVEWRIRVNRVHARLDELTVHGRVSVRTLHDVASLGMVVVHVLTTSGRRDRSEPGLDVRAWTTLATHLAPLTSAEPHDRQIRDDVRRLLDLARPRHTSTTPPARERLLDAIEASLPTLAAGNRTASSLLVRLTDIWRLGTLTPDYLRPVGPARRRIARVAPGPITWPHLRVAGRECTLAD